MSDTSAGRRHDGGRYEIRLKGHLSPRWAARWAERRVALDGGGPVD